MYSTLYLVCPWLTNPFFLITYNTFIYVFPFLAYLAGEGAVPEWQAQADADARVIASTDMGVFVRLAAFKAVIRTYVVGRVVDGGAWMQVVRWLLSAIVCDPSPLLKRKVIKALLKTHADTVNDQCKELENHTSPSGEFVRPCVCVHISHTFTY